MEKIENRSIPDKLYYKIGEVSQITGVEPYVLRYWESEFRIIHPTRSGSKQRLYRRRDLDLILEIKHLLYHERFTIAGAKKRIKELRSLRQKSSKGEGMDSNYRKTLLGIRRELEEIRGILGFPKI
jgi:DNA-binding transcriptional MerR regulator